MSVRAVFCSVLNTTARFTGVRLTASYTMVNIDTPHLTKGDAQPPVQKGLLRLYSMRYCPYAQRAILVLDAKKIPYDTVNANLTVKPEWLFEKSEGGKVPALEFEDGRVLSESLIIADYLDEVYPEPPLYPKDPIAKAQDKLLIEKLGGLGTAYFKILATADGRTAENFENLLLTLDKFEKDLSRRATPFFGGSRPGMVDLMMWPWMERAVLLEDKGGPGFKLPSSRLAKLTSWKAAMLADPAVRLSALPGSVHIQYLAHRKNGVYDFERDSHL